MDRSQITKLLTAFDNLEKASPAFRAWRNSRAPQAVALRTALAQMGPLAVPQPRTRGAVSADLPIDPSTKARLEQLLGSAFPQLQAADVVEWACDLLDEIVKEQGIILTSGFRPPIITRGHPR